MALEPRIALQQLEAALEKHLEALVTRRGDGDASVEQAFFQVEDAFLNYEDALFEAFEEQLPMTLDE